MIYETKGRAREYFELAVNHYRACEHGCVYCYAPDVLHKPRHEFFVFGQPKEGFFHELEREAARLKWESEVRHILLSFIADPYQPAEKDLRITREIINLLHNYSLNVAILTKGAFLATRDFDILNKYDYFGVTLTFQDPRRSRTWEPKASNPLDRKMALKEAHERGIPTWVSLEPVIDPSETLSLIEETAPFVDHYKVGKLNYTERLPDDFAYPRVDWKSFAQNIIILLDRLGKSYYIKRELAAHLGKKEGITKGEKWI